MKWKQNRREAAQQADRRLISNLFYYECEKRSSNLNYFACQKKSRTSADSQSSLQEVCNRWSLFKVVWKHVEEIPKFDVIYSPVQKSWANFFVFCSENGK